MPAHLIVLSDALCCIVAASWRYNHNKYIQYYDNGVSFLPEAVNVKGRTIARASELYFTCAASPVMSGLTNRPMSRGPSKSSIRCIASMRLATVVDSIEPL
jgi:hypothetical protein